MKILVCKGVVIKQRGLLLCFQLQQDFDVDNESFNSVLTMAYKRVQQAQYNLHQDELSDYFVVVQ